MLVALDGRLGPGTPVPVGFAGIEALLVQLLLDLHDSVPVHNAGANDIDVAFIEEHDDMMNPSGAKGDGETGIVGVPAAVANAIHPPTGIRIRGNPGG